MRSATCADSVTVWLADQWLLSSPIDVMFSVSLTLLAVEVDPFHQTKTPIEPYETPVAYLIFRYVPDALQTY